MLTVHILCLGVVLLVLLLACAEGAGQSAFWNSAVGLCERPWRKVYEHDSSGTRIHGNLQELRAAILRADGIRVIIRIDTPGFESPTVFSLEADNAVRYGDQVCVEALSSLNHFNQLFTGHAQKDSFWHTLPCTSGNMHVLGLQLGGAPVLSDQHFKVTGTWFVRTWAPTVTTCSTSDDQCWAGAGVGDAACGCSADAMDASWPVYSHYTHGDPVGRKHISVLINSIQRGQDVRAAMRDRGYSFPMHLVRWDVTQSWVSGQSVAHIGQRHFRTHVGMRTQAPYLWMSSWSTSGKRHNSRWALDGHVSRGANQDEVSLDWMTDACWRHVFTNDAQGRHVRGSLEELLTAVRHGHRVRVVMGNMATEADGMRIWGGHLGAQLLKQLSPLSERKDDHHLLHDFARWRWQLVHTTGSVMQYEVLVNNGTVLQHDVTTSDISWFVDTRPWEVILGHSQGVTSGHVTALASAVLDGASVRLRIRYEGGSGDIFTPAANLKVSDLDGHAPLTSAQAVRYLSDEVTSDNDVRFQERLAWWMTTVDSTGVVTVSAWDQSHKVRYFDVTVTPDIEWFVNY